MTPQRIAAGFLAAAIGLAVAACGGSSPVAPTQPTHPLPPLADMLADKILGSAGAPVTMIEYSSLGCFHCANFAITTFQQIKTTYIDVGRVKFVYRDFPLDEPSMAAAMVARCSGSGYFATLDTLFRNQASWAGASNFTAAIKSVVSGLGITSADVDACLAVSGLRAGILAMAQTGATQYSVGGTPTFIINTQTVVGAQPFATFAGIIDSF